MTIWLVPLILVIVVLLIPAKYDPAMWLKKWSERR
jgi:hypothetical protein